METKVLKDRKIINLVVVLNLIIINAEVDKGIFLSSSTDYISPKKKPELVTLKFYTNLLIHKLRITKNYTTFIRNKL